MYVADHLAIKQFGLIELPEILMSIGNIVRILNLHDTTLTYEHLMLVSLVSEVNRKLQSNQVLSISYMIRLDAVRSDSIVKTIVLTFLFFSDRIRDCTRVLFP